jgi:hypothetical protein
LRCNQRGTSRPTLKKAAYATTIAAVPALKLRCRNSFRLTIGSRSVSFPDQENGQRQHRGDRQNHDPGRIEPVLVVAQVEQYLQRADADDQRGKANVVHLWRFQAFRAAFQLRANHRAGEDADGNVDEEDPFQL